MTAAAVAIQGRVLLALILRETRVRYGRRRIGYLWALIEPILHITVFTALFTYLGRVAALGDSITVFMATGFATYIGFRKVMMRTRKTYDSSQNLLSLPTVTLSDVFIAKAALELATWILVTIILLSGLILLGFGELPNNIFLMLASIATLFPVGFALGVAIGIMSQFVPALDGVVRIPLRMLYFFSGVFYLPENMAPALREVIAWNPVLHGITLFRMGYYPYYTSNVFDSSYLTVWAICSVLFTLLATRVARRPLRNRR